MNPQEKLSEIKTRHTELTLSQHISDAHVNWLIARVEQLEAIFKKIDTAYYGTSVEVSKLVSEALHTGPKPE